MGRLLNIATGASNGLCKQILAASGLTLPLWVILSARWQRDGLSIRDLAAYTGNDLPATSRIVDRMLQKGLVDRATNHKDRRAVRVTLGAPGEALRPLSGFYSTINGHLLQGFSKKEADQLFEMLERVEANARAAAKDRGAS